MKRFPAVIIGAGQAGLAMSRELSRRDVEHLIVEKGAVGDAWRTQRWESLRLLTPNWANALPGARYSGADPDGFMPVAALVDQFETYAAEIEAPVQTETAVLRARAIEGGYQLDTSQGPVCGETLVLATGACAAPYVPRLAQELPSSVFQTTPSHYKRPNDLPEGRVLVVGASASGVQLAREIHLSGRDVTLAVGAHIRLPRRYRGRDIEWWLDAIGVLDERWDEVDDLNRARRAPSPQLIGDAEPVDLNALQELGVEIVGRLADVRGGQVLFSGGLGHHCASADLKQTRLLDQIDTWIAAQGGGTITERDRPEPTRLPVAPRLSADLGGGGIRTVFWATGFRPDLSWLDLPVFDARGRLRHDGGVVDAPGVFALGLPFLRRRRSHQISGVGRDSDEIADALIHSLNARRAA